ATMRSLTSPVMVPLYSPTQARSDCSASRSPCAMALAVSAGGWPPPGGGGGGGAPPRFGAPAPRAPRSPPPRTAAPRGRPAPGSRPHIVGWGGTAGGREHQGCCEQRSHDKSREIE